MQDPVLYPFKRVVNGHEYVVWGYPNALLAQNITKLYDGYFLKATVKDNVTEIFWRSSHFFKPQLKYIGKVIYNLSCDTMIYIKHGFKSELHEFHKDNSFGLCWDVISQMRAKDIVQIEEPTVKPKGKNIYTISVNLAGLPGISLPCGIDSKGLPIGLQLIGDCFKEKNIIRAAYSFEQTYGYKRSRLAEAADSDKVTAGVQ